MTPLFLTKLIKFSLVGLTGLVIDFSVTWLLKERTGWNKYLSNACGFTVAATSNYLWNRLWNFCMNTVFTFGG